MKELLIKARLEILELRRANELLSAQMSVVEVFTAALGLKNDRVCMTIDVAWELQKEIDKFSGKEERVI